MANSQERYIHDYESAHAKQIVQGRTAAVHGAFFLPYLNPGMKLLDCGCGPGTITVGFAEKVVPGETYGIDIEQGQIDIAKANAEKLGLTNAKFDVANVYELPFDDNTFDAVFSHAALEHINDIPRGLKEIKRVLKSGGVFGVRSAEWKGLLLAPRTPELEEIWDLQYRIRQANGGDPFIGSKFRAILREAGFINTKATASYETFGTSEETEALGAVLASMFTDPGAADTAKENNWIDDAGLKRIEDALIAWSKHPDAVFAHPWGEAVGWKP